MKAKFWHEWLQRAVLLAASFVVTIALLEATVRIFFPQSDRFVQYDPLLGWKHPANREGYWRTETPQPVPIRINAHSLRGPEIALRKASGQFRILMLGDSFTEAFQVPEAESHSAVLEQLFRRHFSGRSFEVINSGVGGYSTGQELLYFQTRGKDYAPDAVVLNVCINDLSDEEDRFSGIRPIFHVRGESLQVELPAPKSLWMLQIRDRLLMHMDLASLIRDRAGKLGPSVGALFKELGLGRTVRKFQNLQQLPRTVLLIKALQREANAARAKLVVFLIPPGGLVHRAALTKPAMADGRAVYLLGELAEKLRQEHIAVIEPLDSFREQAASGQMLYFNYGGHWTAAGHALAAKILYDHLRQDFQPQT